MDNTAPNLNTVLYVAALIGVIASVGTTITKKVLTQLKVRGKLGRNSWQIVCLTCPVLIGTLLGLVWRSYGLPGVWGPAVGAAAGAQATTIYAAVRHIFSSLPKWSIGLIAVGGVALYWSVRSLLIIRKRYRLLAKEKKIRDKWTAVRNDLSMKHSNKFFELNEKYLARMKEINRAKAALDRSFADGEEGLSSLVNRFYGPRAPGTDE